MVIEEADREIIELALERICDSRVRSEMAQQLVMNFADDERIHLLIVDN